MNALPLTTHDSPLTEALCQRLSYAAILLVITLAYSPFLGSFFVQDDFTWLEVAVGSSRDITRIFTLRVANFFMPLAHLVFLAEYRLFGLDPLGYYLVNLATHAVNALLLFHLARRILRDESVSLVSALLFAVNSSHFHGMVWISALPRLLLTGLMLASLLALDSYLRTKTRSGYAFSLAFCAAAMLSKEQCVVLLPLLILHLALFDERKDVGRWRQKWACLTPHLLMFVVYLGAEWSVQQRSRLVTEGRYAFGLHGILPSIAAMGALFIPRELIRAPSAAPLLSLVCVLAIVALAIAIRRGHVPARPALYGVLWALVGLTPGSLFRQSQIVAHRHTYIPAAGHAILFGLLLVALARMMPWHRAARSAMLLVLAGILAANALVLSEMSVNWRARTEETQLMKAALDFYHGRGLFGGPGKRLTFLAGTPAYSDHLVSLLYVFYSVAPARVESNVFVPKDAQANLTSSPDRLVLWWNPATQTLVKL